MHAVEQAILSLKCLVKLAVQSADVHKRHRHQAARDEEEHNVDSGFDDISCIVGLDVDDSLAESDVDGVGDCYDKQLAAFVVVVHYHIDTEDVEVCDVRIGEV